MNSISVKKIALVFLLCAGSVLSGCGNSSPEESDLLLTEPGTMAETIGSAESGTAASGDESTTSLPPSNDFYAVTWSLGSDVEASDENEYDITEPEEFYAQQDIYRNYLSGTESDESLGIRRVTAVCINNNYEASRFQAGTSEADVIYEIPVDYGTTMLLALYYNPSSIAKLGSVRSAVPAAVSIAEGYDAYLLHYGYAGGAGSLVSSLGTDHLDAENDSYYDCYYSDSAISSASSYLYSTFTTSARIVKSLFTLSEEGAHFITDEKYRTPFVFNDEFPTPVGNQAKRIRVMFGGFQPYFLYNSKTGLYERYQHGAPHRDTNSGETLAFENVIILYADSSYKNNHLAYTIEGFGSGIYATGGKYVNISWSKASDEDPLLFFDGLGNLLNLNTGHTFVTVTSGKSSVEIKS